MSSLTTQQALPTGTWTADTVHSTVGFAVPYLAGTFQGTFSDFDARLTDGVLRGTAEVASVQVKDPNLEIKGHVNDPAPDPYGGERFGLQLEATVDRMRFGLSWNNPLPSGDPALANNVTIVVDLQLAKES